jgi:hypothetical protein
VARFPDDASGATAERGGLQRALAAARAGLIDVLLVYQVDRFSRTLRDTVTMLDELDTAGVVFRSAKPSTPPLRGAGCWCRDELTLALDWGYWGRNPAGGACVALRGDGRTSGGDHGAHPL